MKKKNMRNCGFRAAVWTLALAALLLLAGCGGDKSETVAEVGDIAITEAALDAFSELLFSVYGFDLSGIEESEKNLYKAETLDTMVRTAALTQYFAGNDVLADADIDGNLAQLKSGIEQQEGLADDFKKKGVTDDTLRYFIETQFYIQALQTEATNDGALPTEEEINAYYAAHEQEYPAEEERRVSHILVGDENHSDEDRRLAEEIREKIASGAETFEDMAREYGSDGTSDLGGDLDYAKRGAYVTEFDDVAFSLQPGVLSDIVETKFGFHVLKVTDIRSTRSIDTQRESIRSALVYELYDAKLKEILDGFDAVYPNDKYPAPEDRAALAESAETEAENAEADGGAAAEADGGAAAGESDSAE
jgi:parvulin-like peptidyl-prolyl isomerase